MTKADTPLERRVRSAARAKRRTEAMHQVSTDRWLISYSDLLTLLFALFAVLLALSQHKANALKEISESIASNLAGNQTTGIPSAPSPVVTHAAGSPHAMTGTSPKPDGIVAMPSEDALTNELQGVLGSFVDNHQVTVRQTSEGIVISFDELGLFRSGDAELLPGELSAMVSAGKVLESHHAQVRVEGHSDDQPINTPKYHSNWELSAARAMAVLRLLATDVQFDPAHLSMAGYGPYRPVTSNDTPEGRQKNRRVDLVVIRGNWAPDKNGAPPAAAAVAAAAGVSKPDPSAQTSSGVKPSGAK